MKGIDGKVFEVGAHTKVSGREIHLRMGCQQDFQVLGSMKLRARSHGIVSVHNLTKNSVLLSPMRTTGSKSTNDTHVV